MTRAVQFKIDVVTEDWKEAGRRAILNYGHTVGHAVEVAGGLGHGDAVGIGMRVAADLSESLSGFEGAGRQRQILERLGLPADIPAIARSELEAFVVLDKKRDDQGLRMVLLEDFGRPVVQHVETDAVTAAMVAAGAVDQ